MIKYGLTSHQRNKSKCQRTIQYQICYYICFDLVQIRSTTVTRVPQERVFAPWVYRMGCATFTILYQFHVQHLWGRSSWSEVAACLQRHEVPPNIHFQDTFFFPVGGGVEASTPVLGVVYSGVESAHQFDLFTARNADGDSWTQIRSGAREGGNSHFTHIIHKRWYLQFKAFRSLSLLIKFTQKYTRDFYNGKHRDADFLSELLVFPRILRTNRPPLSGARDGRVFLWFRWHQHPRVGNWDWKLMEVEFCKYQKCVLWEI